MRYIAKDMKDVATLFDRRASDEQRIAGASRGKGAKAEAALRQAIWTEAAEVARSVELRPERPEEV